MIASLDREGHDRVVVGGYDIGSRVAQAIARSAPERVAGLIATPYFPALARYTVESVGGAAAGFCNSLGPKRKSLAE